MPLAEHDNVTDNRLIRHLVSIHVPLAEHDVLSLIMVDRVFMVSIHVPLAEHDSPVISMFIKFVVSIHVPLAEHDGLSQAYRPVEKFQFTCPSRSTTREAEPAVGGVEFQFTCPSRSTTEVRLGLALFPQSFNSRAPRGARPSKMIVDTSGYEFQFTCPSRSTTSATATTAATEGFQFTCPSRSTTTA